MRNLPLDEGDFTFEAFVCMRSASDDAVPRNLGARWHKPSEHPVWAVGVTGKKSHHKPQSVYVEFANPGTNPAPVQVFSDLPLRIDKPHYIGVVVHRESATKAEVVFHVRDLSNDDEPMASARLNAVIPLNTEPFDEFTLGGKGGSGAGWDGMIDDVRLSASALTPTQLMVGSGELVRDSTVGLWQFENNPGYYKDASGRGNDIQRLGTQQARPLSAETLALADLCHALMNSSEFLYVE